MKNSIDTFHPLTSLKLTLALIFLCFPIRHYGAETTELPLTEISEFITVLELIKKHSLYEKTDAELLRAAIQGMISSLDDKGSYLNKSQVQQFLTQVKGIGVTQAIPEYEVLTTDSAYIKLAQFNNTASQDLSRLLTQAQQSGINKLIIDLRNNPGGLTSEAVACADLFLAEGLILKTRGRSVQASKNYYATSERIPGSFALALLVNAQTASAAEVFAAAIKDHNRGLVIGEQTFGKGTTQSLIDTETGAIRITTAANYRATGEPIEGRGLIPDPSLLPEAATQSRLVNIKSTSDKMMIQRVHNMTEDPMINHALQQLQAGAEQ